MTAQVNEVPNGREIVTEIWMHEGDGTSTHMGSFTKPMSSEYAEVDDKRKMFIDACKERLPYVALPIDVGNTDYIVIREPIDLGVRGWCTDKFNRTVIKVADYLIFQRYTDTHLMLCTKIKENSTVTDYKVLTEMLQREILDLHF